MTQTFPTAVAAVQISQGAGGQVEIAAAHLAKGSGGEHGFFPNNWGPAAHPPHDLGIAFTLPPSPWILGEKNLPCRIQTSTCSFNRFVREPLTETTLLGQAP